MSNATGSVLIMVGSTTATLVYYRMHTPEAIGRLTIAWPPARARAVTRGTRLCEKVDRAHCVLIVWQHVDSVRDTERALGPAG
jgi:hypothetical protein